MDIIIEKIGKEFKYSLQFIITNKLSGVDCNGSISWCIIRLIKIFGHENIQSY